MDKGDFAHAGGVSDCEASAVCSCPKAEGALSMKAKATSADGTRDPTRTTSSLPAVSQRAYWFGSELRRALPHEIQLSELRPRPSSISLIQNKSNDDIRYYLIQANLPSARLAVFSGRAAGFAAA